MELVASSIHWIKIEDRPWEDGLERWLTPGTDRFSSKRKKEWLAGRHCAQKALKKLGVELKFLPSGASRAPLWPWGVVGSISHSDNLAVCAASLKAKSLGVDCEPIISNEKFETIKELIFTPEEIVRTQSWPLLGATLGFSAKECLFKALHPLCGVYIDFLEASLISFDEKTFCLELYSGQEEVKNFNGLYKGGHSLLEGELLCWLEVF